MKTVVDAVHAVTWNRATDRVIGGPDGLLANLVPFVSTTKNFRAERLYPGQFYGQTGRLTEEWAERLKADRPVYVVFSYQTPIAWVGWMGNAVVVPLSEGTDGGSTVTTKKHQSQMIWLTSKTCPHGRVLAECMAIKASSEWVWRNDEVPADHGERWIDE